jgi:hypothetical protein
MHWERRGDRRGDRRGVKKKGLRENKRRRIARERRHFNKRLHAA